MRILYYNWIDYEDTERRGGGVSVYQKNVIDALAEDPDARLFFLSSGIAYDFKDRPYLRRVRGGGRVVKYEIVNSAVLSPGHSAFSQQETLHHPATVAVFKQLLDLHGPFDIVHFNNLEGIPASVLALREALPATKFIISLHNYFPFCPQVNLWYQERQHCSDFLQGEKCARCLPVELPASGVRHAHQLASLLKSVGVRPGGRVWDWAFRNAKPAKALLIPVLRKVYPSLARRLADSDGPAKGVLVSLKPKAAYFRRRRQAFVDLINAHVDRVLVVSRRVGEIAEHFGVHREKIAVSYIGTRHAEGFSDDPASRRALLDADGRLVLCYLGYMRRDKGFYFLIEALENLPRAYAGRIRLVVAAGRASEWAMDRLKQLALRCDDVLHADGYTHAQLDTILSGVTLGVVPVLWEDNLPQVALEMYCRGIPLLCSDRGGAKELGGCPDFTFRAGDVAALNAKLIEILEGRLAVDAFWADSMQPMTLSEHAEQLRGFYRGDA